MRHDISITKNNTQRRRDLVFQLTKPEVDLIMTIRSIAFGEIMGLKIKDRSPWGYDGAKKMVKI